MSGAEEKISADYLVVGAGLHSLSFVDELLVQNEAATFVIVDKHPAPGGHWNVAYPFVTLHQVIIFPNPNHNPTHTPPTSPLHSTPLHSPGTATILTSYSWRPRCFQPSFFYGVNSEPLSLAPRKKGFEPIVLDDLADKERLHEYFTKVMRKFEKSGRVVYFANAVYHFDEQTILDADSACHLVNFRKLVTTPRFLSFCLFHVPSVAWVPSQVIDAIPSHRRTVLCGCCRL